MKDSEIIIKTLEDEVSKWMRAREERQVIDKKLVIRPSYAHAMHHLIKREEISYRNGLPYDMVTDRTSAKIAVKIMTGDEVNGFGSYYDCESTSEVVSKREIREKCDKLFKSAFYQSIGNYFAGHEFKSYNKLPRILEVEYNPRLKRMGPAVKSVYIEDVIEREYKLGSIKKATKKISEYFRNKKYIRAATATYFAEDIQKVFVSSEGSKVLQQSFRNSILLELEMIDSEGRQLDFARRITFSDPSEVLKLDLTIFEEFYKKVAERYDCPVEEAGAYPVLMDPEQIGVLMHEDTVAHLFSAEYILENGLRTFNVEKLGKRIMPEFITLYDNPTLKEAKNWDYFKYDDEGVPTSRKLLVEHGILRNYLTDRNTAALLSEILKQPIAAGNSRVNIESFSEPEPRISNLEIETSEPKTLSEMERELMRECDRTNKEYALLMEGSIGGLVNADEDDEFSGANATFPEFVYRLYPDGKKVPVKLVHTIGSPYNLLQSIMMMGGQRRIENFLCGASSGMVPVTQYAPWGLLRNIEVVSENVKIERNDDPFEEDDDE